MRTTVSLSEEALQLVKAIAHDRKESMGTVMSELIMRGANSPAPGHNPGEIKLVNGWPVVSYGHTVTYDEVRDFLAGDE
ncbi:MAG: hypothetical protein HYX27_17360 [Acidobacteria bacterium]|nr:hypothetical protein [Acidobacteriota bacterium]